MENKTKVQPGIPPTDIAKFFLARSFEDGELISPLKMQKLVYYAYVWMLVQKKERLFTETIEAWPNGPVTPSLYQELKKYGSGPINADFLACKDEKELDAFMKKFPEEIKSVLNDVYEKYMTKTAFELVVLTHSEKPWMEAREKLSPTQRSSNGISDDTIIEYYGQQTQ